MKQRSGLSRLWSGNKFSSIVDEDKTPDISLSSSEDENLRKMDFSRIKLDSDEDEMRIDYMRGSKLDANNNIVEEVDSDTSLNMMQNIQFAELQFGQLELSDSEIQKPDDFLPNVYTVNFTDNENKENDNTSEVSSYNPGHNVKFMSSIESEQEKHSSVHTHTDIEQIKTESIHSSIAESIIHSDIEESVKNYESDFLSESQQTSPSRKISPHKSATNSDTLTSPQKDRRRHKQRQCKSSRCTRTSSESTESESGTISSASSLTSDSHHTSSRSSVKKTSSKRHHRRHSSKNTHTNTAVQTDFIPNTNDILSFKYPWQQDKPHNIAAHVVDGGTLHVLSSYDPSVLAAHDMMKFHFKLLQQHVDNSRRLYQAYSKDTGHSRFKYTTVEDTMEYIKRNRPKVQTYEEVLKEIKNENQS